MIKKQEDKYIFSEPIYNPNSNLWEIIQSNSEDTMLDILSDITQEAVISLKHERIKEYEKGKEVKGRKQGVLVTKNKGIVKTIASNQDLIVQRIIELKTQGEQIYEIVGRVSAEFRISPGSAIVHLNEAMDEIKRISAGHIDEILPSHMRRYEDIYKLSYINRYWKAAQKALRAKEKLLGLGQELDGLIVIDNILIDSEEQKETYSLDRMSNADNNALVKVLKDSGISTAPYTDRPKPKKSI